MDNLIVVRQLPIIEEQLAKLSVQIDERINQAASLVVSEDTVKVAKKIRAELNKEFTELEERRKEIKKAILGPYDNFENTYKKYVFNKYATADSTLKARINEVENTLKNEKHQELLVYVQELLIANNIDFITPERIASNVTLSASMKSLKDNARNYVTQITSEMDAIKGLADNAEIMAEYIKSLNMAQAVKIVEERKKAVEEQRKRQEERAAAEQMQITAVAKIEAALPPPVILAPAQTQEDDPIRTVQFTVTAPMSKLKELKNFLNEGGYEYVSPAAKNQVFSGDSSTRLSKAN